MVFKNTFELKFSSCCNNYYIVHSRYVEVLDKNIFCTISGKVLLPKIVIKHNSALYVFNQSWKGVCLPQRAHIYYLWYINKTHANKSCDINFNMTRYYQINIIGTLSVLYLQGYCRTMYYQLHFLWGDIPKHKNRLQR